MDAPSLRRVHIVLGAAPRRSRASITRPVSTDARNGKLRVSRSRSPGSPPPEMGSLTDTNRSRGRAVWNAIVGLDLRRRGAQAPRGHFPRPHRYPSPTSGERGCAMETDPSPYPLRLTGELSPRLNRGLWLVKWLLAVPHFIVLFFLWIAFVVVSVVAFFAILFTGRYPRGLL